MGIEAIIEAVVAAAPRGQQSAALCAKGDALVAAGDLDGALACFDRALRLDVSFASAWVGRAIILSERQRDNEALACINRALDVDPRCAAALVHKGHILRGRGFHLEALGAYEAALGSGAEEDARAGRAAALQALGRTEDARPTRSLAPAPEAPPGRAKKTSSRPTGRPDPRAEKATFREEVAAPSAPRTSRAPSAPPTTRATSATSAPGAPKTSIRPDPCAEKRSFTADPLVAKKSDPAVLVGPLVTRSSIPPKKSSTRPPGGSGAHPLSQAAMDLATLDEVRALCLASRHVEGLRKLEPIAKRCPSSREAWTLRGQILFSLKQYEPALASVERVAKLDPKDQDALKLMVMALAAMGKDVRALENAERLLALAPRDPEVHRLRAGCLVAAMRHGEAVVAYEKVIQYVPDDPSAWLALGRTLRQLRRAAEARMALTRAVSIAEDRQAADVVAQARELLAKLPSEE